MRPADSPAGNAERQLHPSDDPVVSMRPADSPAGNVNTTVTYVRIRQVFQ